METTTTEVTIKHLKQIFVMHRLPRQIVSDSSAQFIATAFQTFCESLGIQDIKTGPYSPRSNGKGERLVQTFKKTIEKRDPCTSVEIQEVVTEFLTMYRSTPQSSTNQTPSEMLNNRRMRTVLDLLHPCNSEAIKSQKCQQANYDVNTRPNKFRSGELIWACNFRGGKDSCQEQ